MKKQKITRFLALCLALLMLFVTGCGGNSDKDDDDRKKDRTHVSEKDDAEGKKDPVEEEESSDPLVVAIDPLDGLFNPFFATSAADGTVVSMTQIPLLSYAYNEEMKAIEPVCGDQEASVAQDFSIAENSDGTVTYTFVLKNGILFSDGHPLTMEDVLFNYYVYLDPVYTGSNTLYSTAILGLTEYRTQSASGKMTIPNISGIVSLGHTNHAGESIIIGNRSYKVATAHNADGTVKKADEYDVLQITLAKADPTALEKLAIYIAPQHYYGQGSKVGVDIANNQFGVEYASFDFMKNVIQSFRNVKLPMGAGSYKVTDSEGSEVPAEDAFFKDNVVYFKRNKHFYTVGADVENAKIANLQYRVVADAVASLESGEVHFASPAMTNSNYANLENIPYITCQTEWQWGYGYIGINASKVTDINLRKAIMCAMNTSLTLDYFRAGTASQLYWPMSKVSWAYPDSEDNGHDYPAMGFFRESDARELVQSYMAAAGVSAGSSALRIAFTLPQANHPCDKVFREAADLLNSEGWNVQVQYDSQMLTKISTGSVAVWAAAWSSALDPDMYQVYHKDSISTATLGWGYPYLKQSGTSEEQHYLDELSVLIERARATTDQSVRADLYEQAMGYVLDLAIELPVYQRQEMYAYNADVIDADSLWNVSNSYVTPLHRIWEVEFAN